MSVIESQPSRGRQLNLGTSHARGDCLVFVHADTILPFGFAALVERTLSRTRVAAGAFGLSIDAHGLAPRVIECGVFVRDRVLRRPHGDQALLMSRDNYRQCGGFPDLPYMEGYAMLRRLKALGRIHVASLRVASSARCWESRGWLRTTLRHQWLILRHHTGVGPIRRDTRCQT